MAHDVFLSYSQKDKATAEAVCRALERNSVRVWIAPRDIPGGANWSEHIPKAIINARALVLIFSAGANASTYIPRELALAADKKKPIIPIRLANVAPSGSVDFFISTSQWVDAFPPPLESHLNKLVQMTRESLGMRPERIVSVESSPSKTGAKPLAAADRAERAPESGPKAANKSKIFAAVAGVVVAAIGAASVMSLTNRTVATPVPIMDASIKNECDGSACSDSNAANEALPGLDQPGGFFKVLAVDTLEVDGRRIQLSGVGTIISNRASSLNNWMLGKGFTVLCEEEQPFHGRYNCNVGNDHSSVSDYVIKRGWALPMQNTAAQN